MPLQLSVGLSKKQGLPDYGSIGAACSVTVELDHSLLNQDLESFHHQVKSTFVACSQAVNDELARQRQNEGNGVSHKAQQSNAPAHTASGDGSTQNAPNGNGANGHRASQKQVEYINQLARQIRGLGVRRLDTLAKNMFDPISDERRNRTQTTMAVGVFTRGGWEACSAGFGFRAILVWLLAL